MAKKDELKKEQDQEQVQEQLEKQEVDNAQDQEQNTSEVDQQPPEEISEKVFDLQFQIYDQYGGKDSILPMIGKAKTLDEAVQTAGIKLQKVIQKGWTFKFIKEK